LGDAVAVGLGSMLGAGVFASFAPAAAAAGAGLLIALGIAAMVAYCNGIASAQLAARYPESGGVYSYGRHQLGPVWGFLAGWGFVIGKTAGCAAMALTFGTYTWLTGITQAAALLFFAFAGYARIATLGEEVRDPTRIIPRAIPLALGLVVAIYAMVGAATLAAVGPTALASSAAPMAAATQSGTLSWLTPVVRIGGAVASAGALLSLLAVLGFTGCAVLAVTLPLSTVLAGAGVLTLGLLSRAVRSDPRSANRDRE